MKWFFPIVAAFALAIFTLSVPAPIFSSEASANKMNGKGSGCSSGMNCMQDRYYAATKTTPPKKKKPAPTQ